MKSVNFHGDCNPERIRTLISLVYDCIKMRSEKYQLFDSKILELYTRLDNAIAGNINSLHFLEFLDSDYETVNEKKYIKEGHRYELNFSWDDENLKTSLYFYYLKITPQEKRKVLYNGGIIFHGISELFSTDKEGNYISKPMNNDEFFKKLEHVNISVHS